MNKIRYKYIAEKWEMNKQNQICMFTIWLSVANDEFSMKGFFHESGLFFVEEINHNGMDLMYYDRNSVIHKQTPIEDLPVNPHVFDTCENINGFLLRNLELYDVTFFDLSPSFFMANRVIIYWNAGDSHSFLNFPICGYYSRSIQVRIDDDKCPNSEASIFIKNKYCPNKIDIVIYGTTKRVNFYDIFCEKPDLVRIIHMTNSKGKIIAEM